MSQRYAAHLVWVILAAASIGVAAVLPILPVFAKEQGADPHFIGWMIASYSAANLVCLPIGGWLSDRFGRKPVMAIGLLAYGLASLGFLLTKDLRVFIALRAIEGVAAACMVPAAMAYAADIAPEGEQGTILARMTAAETIGILIGPMIGGVMAEALGLGSPFWILGLLCGICLVLLLRLQETPRPRPVATAHRADARWWQRIRLALGLGLAGRNWAMGFSIGMYEVVWPLFMLAVGSTLWQISLSWTLFAVPGILLSPLIGPWIDRVGARRLAIWGAAISPIVTLWYVSATGPWTIILLSALDGVGVAIAYPAYTALLMQVGPEEVRGRVLGWVGTVRTIGVMTASMVVPGVYARDPAMAFGLTAAVLVAGVLWLAVCVLRDGRTANLPGTPPPLLAAQPLAGSGDRP